MAELSDKDQVLLGVIDAFADSAYGSSNTPQLSVERSLSIERYLGRNINPAPEGRSQVRDRTTFETIEWVKPSLLRIFCGSDAIVEFDPVGPEDEELAQQESDYVNYVVTQRNNWHAVCNDWFHDALLSKNGYAHAYWEEKKITESEFYKNLTDDAFALIVQDSEVKVVSHDQRPNEDLDKQNAAQYQQMMQQYQMMAQQAMMHAQQTGQQPQLPPPPQKPQPAFFHDCEVKRVNAKGQVKICVIPPEYTLIDVDTNDWTLDGCNYFEYFDFKTIGELRASGLDIPDVISDAATNDGRYTSINAGIEDLARDLYNEQGSTRAQVFEDDSMKRIRVRYVWVRHDYDGDGINELQYCIWVGRHLLFRQECSQIPVSSITPIPLAHRHIGMSIADSVEDIEDINTNITRGAIDNLNISNTPRLAVSDRVNMSDLLDVRVGGVIRVDGQPPQELMPVVVPDVFASAVQAIQFFDSRRQNRTGINAYFQGTDSNTLNKTASGINQLTQSAAQRVEMIARFFAIGVRSLFLLVHELILSNGPAAEVVKLRNKWVTVDPQEWRKRYNLKIVVGLGTGTKDGQIQQLGALFGAQMQTLPLGISNPSNIYHTLVEMAKATGFAGSERFFTDPTNAPPPQHPPPPEVQVEQMRSQTHMQSKQADGQIEQMKQQLRVQFDQWAKQEDNALEKYKADLKAQVDIAIAQHSSGTQMNLKAMEQPDPNQVMQDAEMDKQMMTMMQQMTDMHGKSADGMTQVAQALTAAAQAMVQAAQAMSAPKAVVRDPKTGQIVGAQTVQRLQ